MLRFKSLTTINDKNRNSSIDIFRSFAILSVVIFHYHHLRFGYLGVDLFFLISGLLVGGLLTKEFATGKKINFFRFFLQRGFKIWPSYYFFLLLGTIVAIILYSDSHPGEIITLQDCKRYIFFYQNYTGLPFHWSFDHVWSLCVEEHFYIFLPVMFIFIQRIYKGEKKVQLLFALVIATIIAGTIFKHLSLYFTHSKDTFSATHNRIDSLSWGVLLNLIITYTGEKLRNFRFLPVAFIIGLILFSVSIYIFIFHKTFLYERIWFRSIVSISFFLMVLGIYYLDFSKLAPLRIIAYYSYNWYLWHQVFVIYIADKLGYTNTGFFVYMLTTFLMAVLATTLIEEPFLAKRKTVLNRIFSKA